MSPRVGVFGGSFDPPHVGHVLALTYALSTANIDQVVVVPCYLHPFSKDLSPFDMRLQMCRAAFDWLPGVSVSDIERELGGESKTLHTLTALQRQHPQWAMRLLIGTDILRDTPRWHAFDQVEKLAPPLVLPRTGYPNSSGHKMSLLPDISSTQIRALLANGDWRSLEQWVPKSVLSLLSKTSSVGPSSSGHQSPA